MPASDAGFKIAARVSGRQLAAVAGVSCDSWSPSVSEVQTTERLADRVFLARRGTHRFVVYMEAYTYWTASAPWSVLSKAGLLSERERLPTVSLVFILRPRSYRRQGGQFRLALEEEPTQQIWFREVCLWKLEPQLSWEDVPGLMALSPLCRQERPPHEVVSHAMQAIVKQTSDTVQRADLLTTLAIFGKLSFPDIDVVKLIGRKQMSESEVIQEFEEEARVETRREVVLETLRIKFGVPAAREFKRALNAINSSNHLARLNRLALRCADVEEFRRRFAKG